MNHSTQPDTSAVLPYGLPEPVEAIILAGGLGTRLREAVPGIPKCLAPVAGRPFLFFVINYLRSQGIQRFHFSVGYRHEQIRDYLAAQFASLDYSLVVEPEPLGTGGAIRLAARQAATRTIAVTNGDTLYRAGLAGLVHSHRTSGLPCTIALKPLQHFDRYGAVDLDDRGLVTRFREKGYVENGLINGGLYVLDRAALLEESLPETFSFEREYLERKAGQGRVGGVRDDGYFIDIGVPQDYRQAQADLARPPLDLARVDKGWTLLLDRDGVINREIQGGYVRNWEEFAFLEGARDAIRLLAGRAGRLLVVSNQRGIGKGLMTDQDLSAIHARMVHQIREAGGRIDGIYYCSSLDDRHPDRKPNPGMAFRARHDFPGMDLSRTIMVGNKPSDMLFGRNAGVYTVFIRTTNPDHPVDHADIDLAFDSLLSFAKAL